MELDPKIYSLCEAVADLAWNFACAPVVPGDSREVVSLSIAWAQEFEDAWGARTWLEDTGPDYLIAIDEWFLLKYRAWHATATSTHTNGTKPDKHGYWLNPKVKLSLKNLPPGTVLP